MIKTFKKYQEVPASCPNFDDISTFSTVTIDLPENHCFLKNLFYVFSGQIGQKMKKMLEQVYNKLKISKIHCHHHPVPPHTHTHHQHHHHHLKQFIELLAELSNVIISCEACLSKALTIAFYCYLKE